ncbi:MAG: hypothetical protein LBL01_04905 [Bifidobacteriaceae bacterium]|jgi:hypothetical protein|nr:hypothetical protein [Bifidobacteriaceae bacterium]
MSQQPEPPKRPGTNPPPVYLLTSAAGTMISRMIRFGTAAKHGHLTIAVQERGELRLYSFARRRWSTPLDGAFVEEGRDRYTFEGGKVTSVALYALPPERQAAVLARLKRFRPLMEGCLYNLPDAVANAVRIRVASRRAFTCVGFCSFILDVHRLPGVVQLADVVRAAGARKVFEGDVEGLERFLGVPVWEGDSAFYSLRLPKRRAVAKIVASQARALSWILAERLAGRAPRR